MEVLQYFDEGRVTAATDLYANTIGALLGAIAGSLIGGRLRFRFRLITRLAANRVPTLLLGAWIGYRLYPYVPTDDLHKYWDALKPLILYPSLTGYGLSRNTVIWLTVAAQIEAIVGQRRVWVLFPLFVTAVLVGKVVIVDTTLSVAETAGAALAIIGRPILEFNARFRTSLLALAFCAYPIAERLEPFRFVATPILLVGSRFWVLCPALSKSIFCHSLKSSFSTAARFGFWRKPGCGSDHPHSLWSCFCSSRARQSGGCQTALQKSQMPFLR